MEAAYAAHTDTATFMLDAAGICRRVVPVPGHDGERARAQADRCIGAQYVASLDVKVAGGLVELPRVGVPLLFAATDANGRISLIRTANLVRFEVRKKPTSGIHERPTPVGLQRVPPEARRPTSDGSVAARRPNERSVSQASPIKPPRQMKTQPMAALHGVPPIQPAQQRSSIQRPSTPPPLPDRARAMKQPTPAIPRQPDSSGELQRQRAWQPAAPGTYREARPWDYASPPPHAEASYSYPAAPDSAAPSTQEYAPGVERVPARSHGNERRRRWG